VTHAEAGHRTVGSDGTVPFQLDESPHGAWALAARDDALRVDRDRLLHGWRQGRVLLLDERGRTDALTGPDGMTLRFLPTGPLGPQPPDSAVLLDEQDGVGYWAMPVGDTGAVAEPAVEAGHHVVRHDLRSAGALLGRRDAALLATAMGLLAWHRAAGFCAVCGSPTRMVKAGWARTCTGCGREEYPRTDPAVICLVHDDTGVNGEHVLLARQPLWPAERYSVLAGFVEVGESLEACVRREIAEEVGVRVRRIRYLGSQPWPFPRSLMVGFTAVADRDAPLRPAVGEIEDAHWVHRDRVRAALAAGGAVPGLRLPPPSSIAGRMLAAWAAVDA